MAGGVPVGERPFDPTPLHTADLPPTPRRDHRIPASAWVEAPEALRRLGDGLEDGEAYYIRRIGRFLLWRAGPPSRGRTRYLAIAADDLADTWTFDLQPDGTGEGTAPGSTTHTRFRTWKEALRDAG